MKEIESILLVAAGTLILLVAAGTLILLVVYSIYKMWKKEKEEKHTCTLTDWDGNVTTYSMREIDSPEGVRVFRFDKAVIKSASDTLTVPKIEEKES